MTDLVSQYKRERKNAKGKRKKYQKRGDKANSIYYSSYNGFDDYYTKINRKIDECNSELKNGIKNIKSLSGKCRSLADGKTTSLSNQYNYLEAMNCIIREKSYCDNKVSEYNRKISKYERLIKENGGIIYPWE